MFIVGVLLGIILGMLIVAYMSEGTTNEFIEQNEELINKQEKLIKENSELREIRLNAEVRATQFARKIRTIEKILAEGKKSNEFDTVILAEIKKELFSDGNQAK